MSEKTESYIISGYKKSPEYLALVDAQARWRALCAMAQMPTDSLPSEVYVRIKMSGGGAR